MKRLCLENLNKITFKNSSQMGFALPFQQLLHPCTFRKSCMNFLTFGVCCYMSQGKWLVYLFTWHILLLFFSFAFQHKANLFRRVYNKDRSGVANVFSVIHMVWEGTRVVHLIWALFPSLRGGKKKSSLWQKNGQLQVFSDQISWLWNVLQALGFLK